MRRNMMSALGVLSLALIGVAAPQAAAKDIMVPSIVLRLVEEVSVAAQEEGVLSEVMASEGKLVAPDEELARIEDIESQLALERAQVELEIAKQTADNDVSTRFAKKSLEVAKAELRRATDAVESFRKSVSQSEMDHLRLAVERDTLALEKADRELLTAKSTAKLKQIELAAAQRAVARRRIAAPIAGKVVEINRRRGEWVKPGDTLLRIVRLDRLRAECYLQAKDIGGELVGCRVTLTIDLPNKPGATFPGKIVFVHPQIDPVNEQVRVWAEVENPNQKLQPGLRGKMAIHTTAARSDNTK